MGGQDRNNERAGDGLPQPEEGAIMSVDDVQESAGMLRRFPVFGGDGSPRLVLRNATGAIRVRGAAGEEGIVLRAVKPSGEVVPFDFVAEVDVRPDGEIVVKARPFGEVQRQVKRITKSLDFQRPDFLDNLGDMIDTLAQMKTAGRNIGQVVLEAIVPPRCDLEANTASGTIQVQGFSGEIELKSASGHIDARQVGGKLAARTASGDVRVDGVDGTAYLQSVSGEVDARGVGGDVVIHTTSGDTRAREVVGQLGFKTLSGELRVERSRLNGFYINSTSGECAIDAILEPGSYEVRTVSGEVALRTQPDFAGVLTGRTVSGNFRCELPYRHADDADLRLDDDDRGGDDENDDDAEISLPGIKIGKGRVDLPGIRIDDRGVDVFGMRIDDDGVNLPGLGMHIGKGKRDKGDSNDDWRGGHWGGHWGHNREGRRERRRSRNRWEFLIGDPALATTNEVRLRIRTVSGSVRIVPRRDGVVPERQPAAATAASPARAARPATEGRGWPDSELWPGLPEAERGTSQPPQASAAPVPPPPPAPPAAMSTAPVPPMPPTAPIPPTPPTPPTPSGEARPAAAEADAPASARPVAEMAEAGATTAKMTEAAMTAEDTPTPVAAETASEPTQAPNAERTRLEILEALERGEITADEALRLLRRLEI